MTSLSFPPGNSMKMRQEDFGFIHLGFQYTWPSQKILHLIPAAHVQQNHILNRNSILWISCVSQRTQAYLSVHKKHDLNVVALHVHIHLRSQTKTNSTCLAHLHLTFFSKKSQLFIKEVKSDFL